MKKLLLFISLFLFFIVSVKADVSPGTITCSSTANIFDEVWYRGYRPRATSGSTLTFQTRNNSWVSNYYKVDSNSDYTLSSDYPILGADINYFIVYLVDNDFKYISSVDFRLDLDSNRMHLYTFNTSSASYVLFYINAGGNYASIDLSNYQMMVEKGSTATTYVKFEDCSTPTPPTSDNIYSSFLTLYIDRFTYLANGFTSNPYLITMVGIILSWVVLELLLHLIHIRGGYKK